MSRAFVREDSEQQWLHEVTDNLPALQTYLTRENNGLRVFEKNSFFDKKLQKQVHEMSNGLRYATDSEGRWYVL